MTSSIVPYGLSTGNPNRVFIFVLLFALIGIAKPSFAQEGAGTTTAGGTSTAAPSKGPGPIAPNRPGFTNGSSTIAPGDALAENGIAISRAPVSQGGLETLDLPETNLRFGVGPALEIDATLPDYFDSHGGNRAFGDGGLGVKYRFYQSKDGNTKASVAPSFTIPTHTAFSSGKVDPSLLFGVQTASGSRWSIASNLVIANPTVQRHRIVTTTISGSVSYTLTSALSVYTDTYDILPRTGPPSPVVDGGLIYLVNNNLQLDLELYEGVGGVAPVRVLEGGISFRL